MYSSFIIAQFMKSDIRDKVNISLAIAGDKAECKTHATDLPHEDRDICARHTNIIRLSYRHNYIYIIVSEIYLMQFDICGP